MSRQAGTRRNCSVHPTRVLHEDHSVASVRSHVLEVAACVATALEEANSQVCAAVAHIAVCVPVAEAVETIVVDVATWEPHPAAIVRAQAEAVGALPAESHSA